PKTSIIRTPTTSLKTSIKTITNLSDTNCLEIQGASLLIEQYQLDDVIEMPGFKPSHQVKEMLEQADVFLLPSITGRDGDMEGIPVALMEAMSVGIPVISTVHSGIPELVESGKSGWLAPENDAQALAERLAAFSLLDSEQVQPIVQCAREKIEAEFNQLAINKQLASLLQTM
ncbi:glycosyltransferase, partial [Citrobacter cronae]|uniref:glycosyltransferase n=1 Tax=Citrobacter cronae TaxID=1748967 RepID=UPI0035106AE4